MVETVLSCDCVKNAQKEIANALKNPCTQRCGDFFNLRLVQI